MLRIKRVTLLTCLILFFVDTLPAKESPKECTEKDICKKEDVEYVLSELYSYTLTHFRQEESMFEKVPYDKVDAHKKMHHKFTKQIDDMKESVSAEESPEKIRELTQPLVEFLANWLVAHIMTVDKEYVDFVNAQTEAEKPKKELPIKKSWISKLMRK